MMAEPQPRLGVSELEEIPAAPIVEEEMKEEETQMKQKHDIEETLADAIIYKIAFGPAAPPIASQFSKPSMPEKPKPELAPTDVAGGK